MTDHVGGASRLIAGASLSGRLGGLSPHVTLSTGAVAVLVLEAFRGSATLGTSWVWPIVQACVAALALGAVWLSRDELRLRPLLLLVVAFQLGWIALHLGLGVVGDYDPTTVYSSEGGALLRGTYPRSEYPPGAVGLFALEAWLGGGATRTTNAFLMVPFQALSVFAVWAFRTRWTPWLAAVVGLWPVNAFYWELRFDLVPTAALVAGLLLARRERWYESGFVLGLGTVVKWTPAIAVLALLLWLLRSRRPSAGLLHFVGFAIPVLVVNVPLLLWRSHEVLAAYSFQSARTVTAESFVYLPVQLFWEAKPGYWYFGSAVVHGGGNTAAVWFQIATVAGLVALAALARSRASAIALAGLAPAFFLLTNRIFSPQFYVLVFAAVVVAAALVVRSRRELWAVMAACAVSTTGNTVLFQSLLGVHPVATVNHWMLLSAVAFIPTLAAAVWLAVRATLQTPDTPVLARPDAGQTQTGIA